jgi:DNA-binding MarR family transcriptional regulator
MDPQQIDSVREFIMFVGQKLKKCTQSFENNRDLTKHEFSILFILGQKGPLIVKEIAQNLQDVSLSTLTRLLDSLEQKQYIERSLDQTDRRSFVITPTAKAKELMESFPQHMEALAKGILEGLTPAERLMLLELFSKVRSHIQSM